MPDTGQKTTGPLEGTLAPTAGSFVGYRVRETVAGVGLNEAVGRTGQVDGTARIERGRIVSARFETDTGTLRSDEARRDDAMRFRGLETDDYPRAAFTLGGSIPKSAKRIGAEPTTSSPRPARREASRTRTARARPCSVSVPRAVKRGAIRTGGPSTKPATWWRSVSRPRKRIASSRRVSSERRVRVSASKRALTMRPSRTRALPSTWLVRPTAVLRPNPISVSFTR